jgi:tetratricopeptide (TPR) repeat protein
MAGDLAHSQSLADDLEKRYPEDTSVRSSYLPTLRALGALQGGQPTQAIEHLQIARPYAFADPAISFFGFFANFYPVYVRGEAYLAAHRPIEATAEFRKILDHRGLLLADPLGARVRLELGRALAQAGNAVQAREAYSDFLALWKDADADIPILKQARAEYANLP